MAELDRQSGNSRAGTAGRRGDVGMFNPGAYDQPWGSYGDTGGASRFFYTAKASSSERSAGLPPGQRNAHPTVKPVALMRWLCRLVTPPGGIVLDPFCGSGSTLVAARLEGFRAIGIDQDADSVKTAKHRVVAAARPLFEAIDAGWSES